MMVNDPSDQSPGGRCSDIYCPPFRPLRMSPSASAFAARSSSSLPLWDSRFFPRVFLPSFSPSDRHSQPLPPSLVIRVIVHV